MSGTWFPAKPVMIACNLRLEQYMADWRHKRETSIQLRMKRGRATLFRGQVPLTRKEAEAECNALCNVIDYMLEAPMNHDGYAAVANLLSLAAQAEKLQAGSQVFVSATDHARIAGALQGVLNNERSSAAVPDPGGHHNGDGEPGA